MVFDKPITIERLNDNDDTWSKYISLHARINTYNYSENISAGADRSKQILTFDIRYCKPLSEIAFNTQYYRIVYNNQRYNITEYDDYMLKHRTIKLIGESY